MFVLRPSLIAGIGVFTTEPLAAGDHLRLWQEEDWRFVTFAQSEADADLKAVRETYCVRDEGGFWCPLDFHRMSIGWYMNHSDTPNVQSSKALNWEYFAAREIGGGEEIVCDYRTLSPHETAPEPDGR